MNPHYTDIPLNDAGRYSTAAGDIEPGTVLYVLGLLNTTIDNPNTTVSKGKLKHIAAQLIARNAMLERENNVLKAELLKINALANTASLTIDTQKPLTEEQKRIFSELTSIGTSLSIGTKGFPGL